MAVFGRTSAKNEAKSFHRLKKKRHNIMHVLGEIKMELPKPFLAALADAITRIDLANCTSENETRYNIAEAIASVCSEFDEKFDYTEFFTACCVWKT